MQKRLEESGVDKDRNMVTYKEMIDLIPDGPEKDAMRIKHDAEKVAMEEATKEMNRKIRSNMWSDMFQGGSKKPKCYDDGDQSPVVGREAAKMIYQWNQGMDYNPLNPSSSKWMKTIFCGDYTGMMEILGDLCLEEVKQQLGVERNYV